MKPAPGITPGAGDDLKPIRLLRHVRIQQPGALPTTLAELGSPLAFVYDTGLLKETAGTNLRKDAVTLNHFAEAPNRRLERLIIFNHYACSH